MTSGSAEPFRSRPSIPPVAVTFNGATVNFGGPDPVLIAGPCVIESRDHALRHAERILGAARDSGFQLVFKSSYDKANRTSGTSFRGVGLATGLEVLNEVRRECGCPVLTDVHSAADARSAGEVVDILQIPAFLCRQTDLLVACGHTGKAINIKKGQFLHPADMRFAAEKVRNTGNPNILLCERGTSFGYRDLVVDIRSLSIMRQLGYPVIFDATHSVQQIGSGDGVSGGAREFVPILARAAIAAGIDGIFLECHENPDDAPSDGPNMLHLDDLPRLLRQLRRLWEAGREAAS